MPKKGTVLTVILICLLLAIFEAKFGALVTASPGIIRVPTDKPTIREAIDAAIPGDIIQVANGTYYERLSVNKRISLVGEGAATTIIDGDGNGTVITVSASNVLISGLTIQHAGDPPYSGILLYLSNNTVIRNNTIIENAFCGLELRESSHNIIEDNLIANNSQGLIFSVRSSDNIIVNNNIIRNNSTGCLINHQDNTFYRNNFINNTFQARVFATTTWDNGAEGNYWSDYYGTDADEDGIGDTAYTLVGDEYPLIEPWSLTKVFPAGVYDVTVQCNSTIPAASFDFNSTSREIRFRMTGPSGASFTCNVAVPKALLYANASASERWYVLLNNTKISAEVNIEGDHTSLHFTGHFSKLEVQIRVGSAEGWDFTLYALGIGVAIAVVLLIIFVMLKKKKTSKGK